MQTNEELALLVKQGDRKAAAQLWVQTEKLIYKLASRYFKLGKAQGFEPEDVLQEGFLALLQAAKYYDPEKGFVFISYLRISVKATLFRGMGVPRNGELPPFPLSLDEQIAGEDDPIYLVDALPDAEATRDIERVEDDIYLSQLREALRVVWDALDVRGREYLTARFNEDKTYAEIGAKFGVTRQAVHDKEAKCLRRFREPGNLQRLRTFLHP